jgi:hypothetical protein
VQHAQTIPSQFPWRTATLAVGVVAAVELVALIAIGAMRLAPAHHAATEAATAAKPHAAHASHVALPRLHPLRPRGRVRVLVLNGNGIAGAAAAQAQRLQLEGYRVGGATNAPRGEYRQSTVMYVPGWAKEARRLAHDAGVPAIGPIDGLRGPQLRGSKLVLLLGT